MKLEQIKNKFFEFENNPRILDFKFEFDDILMWPFIRYSLFQGVINKELGLQQAHSYTEKISIKEKMIYYIAPFILNPFFPKKKYPILMLNWTSNTTGVKVDNQYLNKRDDYYGNLLKQKTLFLEQSVKGKFRYPRLFSNVRNRDLIEWIAKLCKYFFKPSTLNKKTIDRFIETVESSFPFKQSNIELNNLRKRLQSISVQLRVIKELYRFVIKRTNPSLVFVQNSTYGQTGYIVKWLKEWNIKTAEFQHGTVTKGHLGYNFSNHLINNSDYRKYQPDYLLTFGEFWNNQSNSSSKKVVIGSPHFTKQMEKYRTVNNDAKKEKKIITIISQGSLTDIMVDFAIKTSKLIDSSFKIIYRLHPGEIAFRDRYKILYNYNNIEVNDSGDIYSLFERSDIIFGCYSTALYEATAFNKPIFILENVLSKNYIPSELGIWVNSPEEFVEKVDKEAFIKNHDYYWNPNWEENYKKFVFEEIGIE